MVVGLKIVALISSAEWLCVQHRCRSQLFCIFSPWAFFLALGSLRSVYFSLLALFLLSVICLFTASRVKLSCPRGDSSNSLMQKCLQESFFQFSHSECHILTLVGFIYTLDSSNYSLITFKQSQFASLPGPLIVQFLGLAKSHNIKILYQVYILGLFSNPVVVEFCAK